MAVTSTDLSAYLKPLSSGKVRDLYEIDSSTLLFIATDRISAYDVVLKNGIPHKGAILTLLSAHWFKLLQSLLPTLHHHFLSLSLPTHLPPAQTTQLHNRSMQVRRLRILPLEAIVRGYLTGSAWTEYRASGTVHGIRLPPGLLESQKLDTPLYTPSTKAERGGKDVNIHPAEARRLVGERWGRKVEEVAVRCYEVAARWAWERGIIVADTKFEFGVEEGEGSEEEGEGDVYLVDEVLTPDSSRFWPRDGYEVGRAQESFDKQYLRDWLVGEGLKGKEGVEMPESVVRETGKRYREAYERLVGKKWDDG